MAMGLTQLQTLRTDIHAFFATFGLAPRGRNQGESRQAMAHSEPIEMLVRDLMTTDVFTVERNEALLTANRVMTLGRVRHVLVLDEEGRLTGLLSQRDLFHSGLMKALGYGTHAVQTTLDGLLVKEVMTTNLITIGPDAPLKQAAGIMVAKKIGCLPVMEGKKLVGIITEGDFVKLHSH